MFKETVFSKIASTHCGHRSRKEIDHLKEKEEVGGGCTVLPDLILQHRRKVLKSRVKGKGFVHVPTKIWGVGHCVLKWVLRGHVLGIRMP